MAWIDTLIVLVIIVFGMLMIWSRVQQQKMLDTLNEIKEFVQSLRESK